MADDIPHARLRKVPVRPHGLMSDTLNEQALLSLYTMHNTLCELLDIALNVPESRKELASHRVIRLTGSVRNLVRWSTAIDDHRTGKEKTNGNEEG